MTYAGVKALIYCGVSKDDPRMVKAVDWLRRHYAVDANPGRESAGAGARTP